MESLNEALKKDNLENAYVSPCGKYAFIFFSYMSFQQGYTSFDYTLYVTDDTGVVSKIHPIRHPEMVYFDDETFPMWRSSTLGTVEAFITYSSDKLDLRCKTSMDNWVQVFTM